MTDEQTEQQTDPTPQEIQSVGIAGAEAAAAAPPEQAVPAARDAMRERAEEIGLPLTDAQIDQLANVFADKTIDKIAARGGFDPPPEPVQPPPTAPPAPGEAAPPAPTVTEVEAPRKLSWAERHFGN